MSSRLEISLPINGVRFCVDISGAASHSQVIWFHSEFGPFDDPPMDSAILRKAQVRTIHLPGWGVSNGVEAFDTLSDLALACWWLIDAMEIESVIFAGHGFGATLALEVAALQPQRVLGVVAVAPYGLMIESEPGADLFALLPNELRPHMYADPTGAIARRHFPPPGDPHEKGLAAIRNVEVLSAAARFLFPLPDTGIAKRAYRLQNVHIEFVWGEQDGLVPLALSETWHELLPSSHSTVVPNTSHMVPYESDGLSEALIRLLPR